MKGGNNNKLSCDYGVNVDQVSRARTPRRNSSGGEEKGLKKAAGYDKENVSDSKSEDKIEKKYGADQIKNSCDLSLSNRVDFPPVTPARSHESKDNVVKSSTKRTPRRTPLSRVFANSTPQSTYKKATHIHRASSFSARKENKQTSYAYKASGFSAKKENKHETHPYKASVFSTKKERHQKLLLTKPIRTPIRKATSTPLKGKDIIHSGAVRIRTPLRKDPTPPRTGFDGTKKTPSRQLLRTTACSRARDVRRKYHRPQYYANHDIAYPTPTETKNGTHMEQIQTLSTAMANNDSDETYQLAIQEAMTNLHLANGNNHSEMSRESNDTSLDSIFIQAPEGPFQNSTKQRHSSPVTRLNECMDPVASTLLNSEREILGTPTPSEEVIENFILDSNCIISVGESSHVSSPASNTSQRSLLQTSAIVNDRDGDRIQQKIHHSENESSPSTCSPLNNRLMQISGSLQDLMSVAEMESLAHPIPMARLEQIQNRCMSSFKK